MLENIKIILGLQDDKYDQLMLLYISKLTNNILHYCNIKELNTALESFIEDKVVEIMKPKVSGGTQNTGEIKSVSRGDTKIEYNVGEAITDTSSGANLSTSDKTFLNTFRVMRCF